MNIIRYFIKSRPSCYQITGEQAEKKYKRQRIEAFLAGTIGYSLYYVCRTSLNVVKQPIIDSGFMDAGQLGMIGSALLFSYAIGKFINGFLADYSNIKKFMATGLIVSTIANFLIGILGLSFQASGCISSAIFILFAIIWGINGWSQSMGAPPAIIALSRWFPLSKRGTYYGFFSASHNIGEFLSFIFVGLIVGIAGWQWGFIGSSLAGVIGIIVIIFFLHDTPESQGLPPVEIMTGEINPDECNSINTREKTDCKAADIKGMQNSVLRNPGVWILAIASAMMYISRYAINGWGVLFLQKMKGFSLETSTQLISINALFGVFGTVFSGWFSDKVFKGDRKYPALIFGIMNSVALALFLYGGNSLATNIIAMVLFGIAIGVLIGFLGGLMAIDLVPREATGSALGIVGMASYCAAGLQDIASGQLIDRYSSEILTTIDGVETAVTVYDFSIVSVFWLSASIISFLLPLLNWKADTRLKQR